MAGLNRVKPLQKWVCLAAITEETPQLALLILITLW